MPHANMHFLMNLSDIQSDLLISLNQMHARRTNDLPIPRRGQERGKRAIGEKGDSHDMQHSACMRLAHRICATDGDHVKALKCPKAEQARPYEMWSAFFTSTGTPAR